MEEIKFESKILNDFFKEKTKKEKFSKEDIMNLEIPEWEYLDLQNEKIIQSDLDLLILVLDKLNIWNANCENLEFFNMNINELKLFNCNIKGCTFKDNYIEKIEINNCSVDENLISEIGKNYRVKELNISVKPEYDFKLVQNRSSNV